MKNKTLKKIWTKAITRYLIRNNHTMMLVTVNDQFIYSAGSGSVKELSTLLSRLMNDNEVIRNVVKGAYDKHYRPSCQEKEE